MEKDKKNPKEASKLFESIIKASVKKNTKSNSIKSVKKKNNND